MLNNNVKKIGLNISFLLEKLTIKIDLLVIANLKESRPCKIRVESTEISIKYQLKFDF